MLGGIGTQEILIILFIFLLVFGAKRLPELGQAMGRGIREFKRSVSDIQDELKDEQPRQKLPEGREEPAKPQGEVEIARGREAGTANRSGSA
ncbi:MAG TPA: twin-arginine translocase TatA/TatE family subunit [Gemmatimonadota bacterium]|jgi:sec-independent protein translocase protein TatA